MNTHDDFILLQERLEAISREFDLLKKQLKTEQDWPQIGDKYWTFYSNGKVIEYTFNDDSVDKKLIKSSMAFRTEKEATLARDQGLAYRKLWELADGGVWMIRKRDCGDYLPLDFSDSYGIPRFSTSEKAMEAVVEIGEELLDTIFDQSKKI